MRCLWERSRWVGVVLPVVAAPLLVLLFADVGVIDDAYISFRYSYNLAWGLGLVFNAGERVEGYSNLLWTLIMALPIRLGLPVHTWAVIIGLGFGLHALLDTWRICRCHVSSPMVARGAVLLLGLYPAFWLTVTNGMESGLYSFLLVRAVYYVAAEPRPYRASLVGGLLFATRPEGLAVVPILAVYRLVTTRDYRDVRGVVWHCLVPILAPWLAVVALVTLWRLAYYGAWLPNTMVAKATPWLRADLLASIRAGIIYWRGFLWSSFPLNLGVVLAPLLAPRRAVVWLCLAILRLQVPVVLLNSGDWMPHYRLLTTYAPLFAVLFCLALERLVQEGRRVTSPTLLRWSLVVVVLVSGWILLVESSKASCQIIGQCIEWGKRRDRQIDTQIVLCGDHVAVAERINPVLRPGERVSAEALGIFAYVLPEAYVHDMLGLTDGYLARRGDRHHPTFGRSDYAYSYHVVRPVFYLLQSRSVVDSLWRASAGKFNDEYLAYELLRLPNSNCDGDYMNVIVHKDSAARIMPTLQDLEPRLVTLP